MTEFIGHVECLLAKSMYAALRHEILSSVPRNEGIEAKHLI